MVADSKSGLISLLLKGMRNSQRTNYSEGKGVCPTQNSYFLQSQRELMILKNFVTGLVKYFAKIIPTYQRQSPSVGWRPGKARSGPESLEIQNAGIEVSENGHS